MALSERQAGLGAFPALALLVAAQNHGVVSGVQVKPDDVPVFFLELPNRRTEVCADGVL
jgi:hypothetical protein